MCISNTARRRSLTLPGHVPSSAIAAAAKAVEAGGSASPHAAPLNDCRWKLGGGASAACAPLAAPGPLPIPRPLPTPAQQPAVTPCQSPQPARHAQAAAPRAQTAACAAVTPQGAPVGHATAQAAAQSRRNKHDLHVDHPYRDHAFEVPTNEKHITRGGVTEPFPLKLHRMLDQIDLDGYGGIVGWQTHGRCFVVHRPREFVDIVMPRYFKQTKFASFQRQLNLYGFSRITAGMDRGGYYHELFLRGKRFLTHRIHRMRVKGTRVRMASSPDREPNFYSMTPLGPGGPRGGAPPQQHPAAAGMPAPPPPPLYRPPVAQAQPRADPRPAAQAQSQPQPRADPLPAVQAQPLPRADPWPAAQSQPQPQPRADPWPAAQAQHQPQPRSDPQPAAQAQPQPRAYPRPAAQAQPQPQADPWPAAQAQPQPQADPWPTAQAQPQPQADPWPAAQAQPQPQADPWPTAQAQPQPRADPWPTAQAQPQPQADTRPAAQPQTDPRPTAQVQPQPQPQPLPLPSAPVQQDQRRAQFQAPQSQALQAHVASPKPAPSPVLSSAPAPAPSADVQRPSSAPQQQTYRTSPSPSPCDKRAHSQVYSQQVLPQACSQGALDRLQAQAPYQPRPAPIQAQCLARQTQSLDPRMQCPAPQTERPATQTTAPQTFFPYQQQQRDYSLQAQAQTPPRNPYQPQPQQPRPPHQQTQAHTPPQLVVPCANNDDDDDLDEVMFEGRIFHYLKPFTDSPRVRARHQSLAVPKSFQSSDRNEPPPPPQLQQQHQQAPGAQRAHSMPPIRLRMAQGPIDQLPQSSVVPASPALSSVPTEPRHPGQDLVCPLSSQQDGPEQDMFPPQAFEVASRLAQMVHANPVCPGELERPASPKVSTGSMPCGCSETDLPPASPSAGRLPNAEPLSSSPASDNVVSDDEHSSGHERLQRALPSDDTLSEQVRDEDMEDAAARDSNEDGCVSDEDDGNGLMAKEAKDEMESFFATLDLPLEDDKDITVCLADDLGFGYMLERVLE